jgi:hypothetical protein
MHPKMDELIDLLYSYFRKECKPIIQIPEHLYAKNIHLYLYGPVSCILCTEGGVGEYPTDLSYQWKCSPLYSYFTFTEIGSNKCPKVPWISYELSSTLA